MGQAGATLLTTTLQDVAAIARQHPLQEAVFFGALSLFGLICPFRHMIPIR
jgi:hypothetical protein